MHKLVGYGSVKGPDRAGDSHDMVHMGELRPFFGNTPRMRWSATGKVRRMNMGEHRPYFVMTTEGDRAGDFQGMGTRVSSDHIL